MDEEDKLGQPMLSVEWQRSWGRLAGMALFGFRERSFPGPEGRLRLPLPVDTDETQFPDGERLVDVVFRYSHFIGDFDVGVALFHGTGREPAFRTDDHGSALIPVYSRIIQGSLDLQYTRDAWLWKLESLVRSGQGSTFGAAVAGRVESERRLTANLKLELDARIFTNVDPESVLWFFRRDSFVTVRLGAFF